MKTWGHGMMRKSGWAPAASKLKDTGTVDCQIGPAVQRGAERDNVVYWKTNGKINDDLQ